jgi:hypothetical protein
MKPGARHLVMEMARRKALQNSNGKGLRETAKKASIAPARLAEAGLVIDLSLDGDLVRDVLSGDKKRQQTKLAKQKVG